MSNLSSGFSHACYVFTYFYSLTTIYITTLQLLKRFFKSGLSFKSRVYKEEQKERQSINLILLCLLLIVDQCLQTNKQQSTKQKFNWGIERKVKVIKSIIIHIKAALLIALLCDTGDKGLRLDPQDNIFMRNMFISNITLHN